MYIILLIFLLFLSEKALSNEDLLNVVVTPSKFDQKIDQTNSFIEIITADDIKRSSASTIIDLLNSNTSLGIASTGGTGSIPSYFLRGFAKKYLKVTVDGMDVSDPTATQSETYLQNISLGNIKQIEILKSPQGSIHGGQAGGGVIAITTKQAKYNSKNFSQKVEVGSRNTLYSGTYLSFGKNNYKVSANVNGYHTDGISSMDEDDGNLEKDAYNFGNVTVKANLKSTQNNVTFVFRDSSSKYEYDDSYNKKDSNDFSKTNIQSGLVKFEFKSGRKLNHIISYNPTRVNRRAGGAYPSNQSSKQHKVEYLLKAKLKDNDFIALGLEHNNTKYKNVQIREKRESNSSFLQGQFQLTEKLNVDSSFREDEDQHYGDYNSYRTQFGYDLSKDLKLKMSKGTGYRPPSLYEGNNLANGVDKLSPEETSNSEIGFDYKNLANSFFLSGSYFKSRIKNKIDYVWSSGGYLQGSGKTEIDGYEITSKKYINKDLFGILSYTFTDSDETGKKGALVPMHKLSTILNYDFSQDFRANLNLIYQEKAYDTNGDELPAFTLLGSGLNYDLNENLHSYLKFNNILNQNYQVNRNYGTPDFSFIAGIENKY